MKKNIMAVTVLLIASFVQATSDRLNTLQWLHSHNELSAAQYVLADGSCDAELLSSDLVLVEQHAQGIVAEQQKRIGFVYDKMIPGVLTAGKYISGFYSCIGTVGGVSLVARLGCAWYGPVGSRIGREIRVEHAVDSARIVEKALQKIAENKIAANGLLQEACKMGRMEFIGKKWSALCDNTLYLSCHRDDREAYWAVSDFSRNMFVAISLAVFGGLMAKKLHSIAVNYDHSHKEYMQLLQNQWEQDQAIIAQLKKIQYEQLSDRA